MTQPNGHENAVPAAAGQGLLNLLCPMARWWVVASWMDRVKVKYVQRNRSSTQMVKGKEDVGCAPLEQIKREAVATAATRSQRSI